jgi:periplasmic protein TonB
MFEDSTFESNGKIKTRSRFWMIATLGVNGSILLSLILIPLIHPEALPRLSMPLLMCAPPPPPSRPPAPAPTHQVATAPQVNTIQFYTQPTIRNQIAANTAPDGPPTTGVPSMGDDTSVPGGTTDIFRGHTTPPNIHPDVKAPVRVPSSVEAAMILQKTLPIYPPIAKAAGVQGTVILAATISKAGTIENLRVMGGPVMLQRAALDAVETWRYKPYLLDGQPVEVETSVSVIFTMQR